MKSNLLDSILKGLAIVVVCWAVHILNMITPLDLRTLGIVPRDLSHIVGIFLAPILHGDWNHLISNSTALFLFTAVLFYIYPKIATKIITMSWIFTGLAVWLFADIFSPTNGNHIGASGLIFAEGAFLMLIGIFRKDVLSLFVSMLVVLFYGSMMWGVLPCKGCNVSWESHFDGAVIGGILAWRFRKKLE